MRFVAGSKLYLLSHSVMLFTLSHRKQILSMTILVSSFFKEDKNLNFVHNLQEKK